MKKLIFVGIAVLAVILLVAWYLISPLFIDRVVDEERPSLEIKDNAEILDKQQAEVDNKNNEEQELTGENLYEGNFVGADSSHRVEGQAIIFEENGKKYLRFENFKSTNGPDLKVYLSEDNQADSYVSLGDLKGNIGNQNYEIPSNVDISKYDKVLIWCEPFSVLFGHAQLQ